MKPNYTYQEWLDGSIVLKYATVFFNEKNDKHPILVDYSDFSIQDEAKIKKHQQLLFREGVTDLLAKWQLDFDLQSQKSQNKVVLNVNRIALIEEVLFGKKIGIEFTNFEPYDLVFYSNDLIEIRDYATRIIIDGQDYQYKNVQSPNSHYNDSSKIQCELYAQALWEQMKLLKDIPNHRPPKTERNWFKIGLLFANGEMDELIEKHKMNTTAIAREIGMLKSRPYISDSMSNFSNGVKNIFANAAQLAFIKDHCEKNDIPIVDTFIVKANSVRKKQQLN
jgi:hypothetical protein